MDRIIGDINSKYFYLIINRGFNNEIMGGEVWFEENEEMKIKLQ